MPGRLRESPNASNIVLLFVALAVNLGEKLKVRRLRIELKLPAVDIIFIVEAPRIVFGAAFKDDRMPCKLLGICLYLETKSLPGLSPRSSMEC